MQYFSTYINIPPGGINKNMKKIIKNEQLDRHKILNRLARIEGQVKGIRKMIEDKKPCASIIMQITAIKQAVNMVASELLENELICKFERGEKIEKKDLERFFKTK